VPFALVSTIVIVAVVMSLCQAVAAGVLPDLAHSRTPLADAAFLVAGSGGALALGVGSIVSMTGNNAGQLLSGSRTLFALAETGELPSWFGRVHTRFRTPANAILFSAAAALALALTGSFAKLAVVSALARLFAYAGSAAATLVLRRPALAGRVPPARFVVPGGPVVPSLALIISLGIIAGATTAQLVGGGAALAAGAALFCLSWRSRRRLAAIVVLAVLPATVDLSAQTALDDPQALARAWDAERVSPPVPPLVTHAEVQAFVARLPEEFFRRETIGRSVEGRAIAHVWFGRGTRHVLMWSQMHGDEPTATAALFDLLAIVHRRRNEPAVARLLDELTVHVVPMLNPDGAERFQRRNAQGIDINRDALRLQTPEGRALKALRDRVNPVIGFNLHNQNWRTSAGRGGQPASISLLAVAFDEARSESPGRTLARKTAVVIREALDPLAAGRIARYDDEFEPRAFGDNITKWGTPVVLVESGAWPGRDADRALVRLNFVALVSALDALATGRVEAADPRQYDSLPLNRSDLFQTLVREATIVPGTGVPPFVGDVGIVATRVVETPAGTGRRRMRLALRIEDLGDLRVNGALEVIEAKGLTLAPRFDVRARPGDVVRLPAWTPARPSRSALAVGAAAEMLLLRPLDDGRYRVERIFAEDRP
jgi:hypothetical protein